MQLSKNLILAALLGTLTSSDVNAIKLQNVPVQKPISVAHTFQPSDKLKKQQEDVIKARDQVIDLQKKFDAYDPALVKAVEEKAAAKKKEEEAAAKKKEEDAKKAEALKKGDVKDLKVEEVKQVAKKEVLKKGGAVTGDPHVSIGGKDPREEL